MNKIIPANHLKIVVRDVEDSDLQFFEKLYKEYQFATQVVTVWEDLHDLTNTALN
ncbi:MAG: hypothetical protein ABIP06_00040 [Pyrinomonadaceae bacterium]